MRITCTEVEQYLHEHIPLSKKMAVSVVSIDGGVTLAAPLLPNINHRSTVFGGSISALAILSAWTLIHVRFQELSLASRIVIQSNSVKYIKPIEGDFQAVCIAPSQQNWDRFVTTVVRKGKGRILLDAEIYFDGAIAGTFQGEYVALKLKANA